MPKMAGKAPRDNFMLNPNLFKKIHNTRHTKLTCAIHGHGDDPLWTQDGPMASWSPTELSGAIITDRQNERCMHRSFCLSVIVIIFVKYYYIHNFMIIKDGCVVLTKLILEFGENQLSSLFDGLLYGDEPTKQILMQFINLIMVLDACMDFFIEIKKLISFQINKRISLLCRVIFQLTRKVQI